MMNSTKMREENRTNLLDLPNKYRNFDGEFSASCGLDNAEELLIHSQSYFIEWFQQGYSFHQFAEKFAHQGLSLWSADEISMRNTDKSKDVFAFYLAFDHNPSGYILVQCQLDREDSLQ